MTEQTLPVSGAPRTAALAGFQTEGRTREPQVEAQVRALLAMPRHLFWHQARYAIRKPIEDNSSDPNPTLQAGKWVQEESLVCLLRIWLRSGERTEQEQAWEVAELLIERCTQFIHLHIACWKLSPQHVEECKRDIQVQMLQDLFNTSQSAEFWEIRFWLCLKRRLLNIVKKYRVISETEVTTANVSDEEGKTEDFFDRVAGAELIPHQVRVEARQALRELPELERKAYILYHYEDYSQEQIAADFNVTDRTVRNWLTRANQRMTQWRDEVGGST